MMSRLLVCLSTLVVLAGPVATGVCQAPKLGVAGDSLVDEYSDQNDVIYGINLGYAKNGFELMVSNGKADGGSVGAWGGTRNDGYQYNWSLAGSTTTSLLADDQHTNLSAQVTSVGLNQAILVIGANDLFPVPPTGGPGSDYEAIYEGLASSSEIATVANRAVNNVLTAAAEIKSSGVDLIVATAPDYGIAPFTKNFYTEAAKRERVDDVVEFWNSEATRRLTEELLVPVVDLYGLSKDIFGDHGFENETFELGGVQLDLDGAGGYDFADVLSGTFDPGSVTSDTEDAFVHDGIHPNTVVSGIFANLFMTGFNLEHGGSYTLFSEQELLLNGGSNLGAQFTGDTLVSSLGGKNYSDYVIGAVPEPSAVLVLIGVFGLMAVERRR